MPLTQVQSGMMDSTAQYYSFKNRIINGAMVIAQRATSAALQFSSTNYTVLDRYVGFMNSGSQSGTFSRAAITDLTGFNYCAKLQRTAAGSNTANIQLGQAIETLNCADLAGQTVTLSFYAKAGANFSAASSSVFVQFAYGTGTDQSFSNMTGNLWTGQVNMINFVYTPITTTWARYSFTGTLGATASQIGFQVGWVPVGTAGADDALYITGVQIEKGSTATSFDYRPYGTELALCQRYFCKTYDVDVAPGTVASVGGIFTIANGANSAYVTWSFPVNMRAAPTVTAYNNSTGATGTWRDGGAVDRTMNVVGAGQRQVSFSNFVITNNTTLGGQAIAAIEL